MQGIHSPEDCHITMVCCISIVGSCMLHFDMKQSVQEGICGHQQLSALDTRRRTLQEKHRASNISPRTAAQSQVEQASSGTSHSHELTIQQVRRILLCLVALLTMQQARRTLLSLVALAATLLS